MFTPQRKPFMMTPRSETRKIGGVTNPRNSDRKGKAVAFSEDPLISTLPPPPPTGTLTVEGVYRGQADDLDMDDWRRFAEVGLLNEASMEKKDREALLEKISTLEKELYGYQHNMGLLLMENKDWISKHEQLNQAFEEAHEILKREQSSHLYALKTVEQREENLRKALGLEKQCVEELEKALREIQEENSKIRLTSEAKLAEANALVSSVTGRSSDVENTLFTAESKLAEATRKNSELVMRLKEVETRESVLQQERLSFAKERESYEEIFHKQREYLHEWEKKLQEKEESMPEQKRNLHQREEKVNEKENKLKLKVKELEELDRKVNLSLSKCKETEEDITKRLEELTTKEKEARSLQSNLLAKESELRVFEEKLIAKEGTEIQELIDDQKEVLAAKMLEFEQECEEKRNSLDKELQRKIEELERQKVEIDHSKEKLQKRIQATNQKYDRVNEKEMDLEAKLKTIKEKEKIIQAEEKKLGLEKQQLLSEKGSLEDLQQEIERIRAEMKKKEEMIQEECKSLEIKKEEREEYLRLQSELKSQIEKSRLHEEFLSKEVENLKQEKERFEKEWEILDEKQAVYSKERIRISDEKTKFERFQLLKREKLEKKEIALRVQIKQELNDIRLQRESFEANMEHERAALHEKAKIEHSKVIDDLEMMRRNLEIELQEKKEQDEKDLQDRLAQFDDKRMKELSDINHQKQALNREMEEMVSKRTALQKESEEIAKHKKKLEEQQVEMYTDINELSTLSINLKKRREEFASEKARFLAFVQKLKDCGRCGQLANEFVLSDLQLQYNQEKVILPTTGVLSDLPGSSDASDSSNMKKSHGDASGGGGSRRPNMSILQKCTSVLFSPSKRVEHGIDIGKSEQRPSSSVAVTMERKVEKTLPIGLQSGPSSRSVPEEDEEYTDSRVQETSEGSQLSELQSARRGRGRPRKAMPTSNPIGSTKHASHEELSKDELRQIAGRGGGKRQHIDDTATGGRRKRQQTVAVLPQSPGQRRYNLRGNKTVEPVPANVEDSADGGEDDAHISPSVVPSKDNVEETSDSVVESLRAKRLETSEGGVGRVVTVETIAEVITADNNGGVSDVNVEPTANIAMSPSVEDDQEQRIGNEDMNEQHESGYEEDQDEDNDELQDDDDDNDDGGDDDDDDDDDDDGSPRPGEGSIRKKLWPFLTT